MPESTSVDNFLDFLMPNVVLRKQTYSSCNVLKGPLKGQGRDLKGLMRPQERPGEGPQGPDETAANYYHPKSLV